MRTFFISLTSDMTFSGRFSDDDEKLLNDDFQNGNFNGNDNILTACRRLRMSDQEFPKGV